MRGFMISINELVIVIAICILWSLLFLKLGSKQGTTWVAVIATIGLDYIAILFLIKLAVEVF